MSEKNVQIFTFEEREVRVVERDGSPWWVAKDVCEVLELSNTTEALRGLEDDEKVQLDTNIINPEVGGRGTYIVSEAGLYSLILRSRKPEAKHFKRWVTHDVLPAIRATGAYVLPGSEAVMRALTNPDNIMAMLGNWKKDRDRRLELEEKVREDEPKVFFAETYRASKGLVSMGTMAKILNQRGANMGQNRFFKWCVERRLLMRKGRDYLPTQRAMDLKIFEIKHGGKVFGSGETKTFCTVYVTGKGQLYFVEKFRDEMTMLFPDFSGESKEA